MKITNFTNNLVSNKYYFFTSIFFLIISLLYLNKSLFAINSDILFSLDFIQAFECVLCSSLVVPTKADFSKEKFSHVIDKEQLELFSGNTQDVLIGSLLGDGCISKAGRGPYHFRFKQSIVHAEYFFFMYFILENFLTPGSPNFSQFFDKRYNKDYFSLLLLTNASSKDVLNMDYLRDLFYKLDNDKQKHIKIIPENISDFLSPMALAFWLADDGHFYHNGIFLNTQSYSEDGIKLLIEALKLKLKICAKPVKVSNSPQQLRIFIPAKELELVKTLVMPYMCKAMHYKLGIV